MQKQWALTTITAYYFHSVAFAIVGIFVYKCARDTFSCNKLFIPAKPLTSATTRAIKIYTFRITSARQLRLRERGIQRLKLLHFYSLGEKAVKRKMGLQNAEISLSKSRVSEKLL